MWGIHRSPVNSTHNGQWRGALIFLFFWSAPWINGWVNNCEAGDLIRYCSYYDVIVMVYYKPILPYPSWVLHLENMSNSHESTEGDNMDTSWLKVCAQLMRDGVTWYRRLSLAGCKPRISPLTKAVQRNRNKVHGRCGSNFKSVIFKLVLGNDISCYKLLRCGYHKNLICNESTMVQLMVWCRKATGHYLSQSWSRFMSPYGVIRPHRPNYWQHFLSKPGPVLWSHDNSIYLI